MYTVRIHSQLEDRLDAEFYNPEALKTVQKIDGLGKTKRLGQLIADGYRVVYHGTDSINGIAEEKLLPFLSPTQIDDQGSIDFSSVDKLPLYYKDDYPKGLAVAGELLIEVKGNVSKVGVVPEIFPKYLMVSGSLYKASFNADTNSRYVLAFLRSKHGQVLKNRLTSNTIINYIAKDALYSIPLFVANSDVQKFIGDKVRQAERLRAWGKVRGAEVESLASNEAMKSACATTEKLHNRPQLDDLSHRLDPKYYGNRAVAVFRQAKALGKPLSSLVKGIANGIEERVFFNTGRNYITVTEVSSGRMDMSSAPKISHTTEVPDKAIIHERCALVVRTGSIGTAIKVDERDRGAVISSHLIRLEFPDEADAAAVAAYLCSTAGKVLQHKISYGAVQPQIGQDELLALPIPQFVLDAKEQILALVTEQESAIRASKSLTTTAKYLVEALIEGLITEAELIAAEQALQASNDQLDRRILNRLKTDGIDGQGAALFGDLDELYHLLTQAEGD
ncbi:restriction endonuclease subunit S [Nitrosomonas communis]|uniref:Type I restriction enzyme, S subunit n=1 Tax=Nitrosomonas communis TaxID=44574 RepID=A0A1I4LT43_9PROT|nr:restriction endonuclease subunit S [Nitrosomonas communis]SFL94016.1 type I restriction enzyme, S subunit [Nitrosomonas communis]